MKSTALAKNMELDTKHQTEAKIGLVQEQAQTGMTMLQTFQSSPKFANATPETKEKMKQAMDLLGNAGAKF